MLLEVARRYADLVQGVEVERFRVVGESYELRAMVSLRDGSKVCVHVGASDVVEASEVRTLDQVFAYIRRHGSCQ